MISTRMLQKTGLNRKEFYFTHDLFNLFLNRLGKGFDFTDISKYQTSKLIVEQETTVDKCKISKCLEFLVRLGLITKAYEKGQVYSITNYFKYCTNGRSMELTHIIDERL